MTIQDQPPPVQNASVPIWELVIKDCDTMIRADEERALLIADMRERHRIGCERYGTPLQANNGRDALVDAYQEALDLCAYLKQASIEGVPIPGYRSGSGRTYTDKLYIAAVRIAAEIRKLIRLRKGE